MASLSALPPELLLLICDEVDPEDFLSFSLLNQRIYASVERARRRHHSLWTKHSFLEDKHNSSPWFWFHVLRSVISGWKGAQYVRHLKINWPKNRMVGNPSFYDEHETMHDWNYEEHKEVLSSEPGGWSWAGFVSQRRMSALTEEDNVLLKEMVNDQPWCRPFRFYSRSTGDLSKNNMSLALLIAHLPNLRTLECAGSTLNFDFLNNAALYAATYPSIFNSLPKFMTRLTKVNLISQDSDYSFVTWVTAEQVAAFISLPSIKTFAAERIAPQDFRRKGGLPPPKVDNLTLLRQDMTPNSFSALLEGCNTLKTLHLTTKDNNWGPKFDARQTIKFLLTIAADTMEKLTIHAEPYHSASRSSLRHQPTLAGFTRLKILSISFDCFFLPSAVSTTPYIHPSVAMELAGLLPPSLVSLSIIALRYRARLAADVQDLLTSPSAKEWLPHLSHLEVKGWLYSSDQVPMLRKWDVRKFRASGMDSESEICVTADTTEPAVLLPIELGALSGPSVEQTNHAALI
ncbi:hypothetical protein MMC10_005509 [Thelotrema lepadinum]|nr:hypothetical protein [Thelotrema lepadinum]